MCQKAKHKSKEAAIITQKRIGNKQLNAYCCPECKAWHLGTSRSPLRKMDRINYLIDRAMK